MVINPISAMTQNQKMKMNETLRLRILHFFVYETFSSITNLSILLARDYSQTYRLCRKMEEEGLIRLVQAEQATNRHATLAGVTRKGIEELRSKFFLKSDPIRTFMPSKIGSVEQIKHRLKIQLFRARYTSMQYELGQPFHFMSYYKSSNLKPQPDFLIHVGGCKKNQFFVELELTQKSKNRYNAILADYAKTDEHVIYLFESEADLLKIGKIIAKCLPRNWKPDNYLLFTTIDRALEPKRKHWEWGQDQYCIHNGLSIVVALDINDLINGQLNWKKYDFFPYPLYSENPMANRFANLCGKLDRKGRILPEILVL